MLATIVALTSSNKYHHKRIIIYIPSFNILSNMYKALYTQGTTIGDQRIDKWTPANLSPTVDTDGHGSKFVHNIIKQVLQEVNQTPLDVAWYLVRGDTHVKYTELLLGNEIDEVHMIGIGGIGKNTCSKRYLQLKILMAIPPKPINRSFFLYLAKEDGEEQ